MSEAGNDSWTVRRIITWMSADFERLGLDSPRLDAELLVAHALEVDRVRLYMDLNRPLSTEEREGIRALVKRRRAREPVAYIRGKKEFYGRSFLVDRAVLIPRPDTETLVERALSLLERPPRRSFLPEEESERAEGAEEEAEPAHAQSLEGRAPEPEEVVIQLDPDFQPAAEADPEAAPGAEGPAQPVEPERPRPAVHALDLCAGSGAIGLTLAAERPTIRVDLSDLSKAALGVAEKNAEALGLRERVELFEGDLFAALPAGRRYALIASNPPYIAPAEEASLAPEILRHEPHMALFADERGLAIHRRIAREAPSRLLPGGSIFVEVGASQAEAVRSLYERDGRYEEVRSHRDLGGIERVVEARLRG